jgi:hypothetical protein
VAVLTGAAGATTRTQAASTGVDQRLVNAETWILVENTRSLLAMVTMSGGDQLTPDGWEQIDSAARLVVCEDADELRVGFTAGALRVRLSRAGERVAVEIDGDPVPIEDLTVICGVMQRHAVLLGSDPQSPLARDGDRPSPPPSDRE